MKSKITLLFLLTFTKIFSQGTVEGYVTDGIEPLPFANVYLKGTKYGTTTDETGKYTINNIENGEYQLSCSFSGYKEKSVTIMVRSNSQTVSFELENAGMLEEVVVSGTLKPVSRLESPVPVEVYKPEFFRKNPTPNLFEGLQNVNGVRPQVNCSVCNTGDIHINGLEGPYTMVLIDGMPLVSGLSTVYGLSGIPNSLIERMEIVKGPASSLYGSEAVGGLINVITKQPSSAPMFFADYNITTWLEQNLDLGFKAKVGNSNVLTGINYYLYNNPIDNNNDNFTDVTLQDRISIFQKWAFNRKKNRVFTVAGRYYYEDRWGGEMQWTPEYRGGNEIYGESIYTSRYELLSTYQLPTTENMFLNFSYTDHDQNSVYGDAPYNAKQRIGFGQYTWDKNIKNHGLLLGAAVRYQYYNDDTPATVNVDETTIPSVFVQDEIGLSEKHKLLLGARYDYDSRHGSIFTPRIAYKWQISENSIFRLNSGTGFRVVNLFTEDHAAVSGSRDVIITEELKPEESYNVNLNYLTKIFAGRGNYFGLDLSTWYTYFTNKIAPDYDTNPNEIIYSNLDGHAVSTGFSANIDFALRNGIRGMIGGTVMSVTNTEDGVTEQQILTEKYSGTWSLSYRIKPWHLNIDYTGNFVGPMRLPLLSDTDPRQEYSPLYSLQNIQFTYDGFKNFEIYGGVKNLLNWTPNIGNPFIIARANDPFDKSVHFRDTQSGQVVIGAQNQIDGRSYEAISSLNNPDALTFDPTYVYAPNQGIRGFIGIRYSFY